MKCAHDGCTKRATFNVEDQKPKYCNDHKTPDMVNVRHQRCEHDGCKTRASFNVDGEPPRFCNDHKTPDMINVVSTRCAHDGCTKIPTFNVEDERPMFCGEHKTDDMVNVGGKRCEHDGCTKIPSYNVEGERPMYCSDHKTPDMVDVVHRRCSGYNGVPCPTAAFLKSGRDYCLSCDPDDSRRLSRKRDEEAFFKFLKKHGVDVVQREFQIQYMCIDTAKKSSRIDGVIITKDIVVCLELDEDAHERYDQECEESRMHDATAELKLAYPDHHVAWIRVNPHVKKNGVRDTSRNAVRVRDRRHREALVTIRDVLDNPRTDIVYIGYDFPPS